MGLPKPLRYGGQTVLSAFIKKPVRGPVFLSENGLSGDEQADLKAHGGPDKAVCVYPGEHLPYWQVRLGRNLPPAPFGENFTTFGLLEQTVHIGDIFRVGSARVQVSQPRQPCFKLSASYQEPKLALWVQETGYTGFYLRCLEPGWVSPGDLITLLERDPQSVSVAEANRVMHHDKNDLAVIEQLLRGLSLSKSWRATLEKRLAGCFGSDKERLEGPGGSGEPR
ncbi:MAG: MOSC domain-containing protein [Truepera sp.]|nr:MOSC domain-containing protein [Truepera sp.]